MAEANEPNEPTPPDEDSSAPSAGSSTPGGSGNANGANDAGDGAIDGDAALEAAVSAVNSLREETTQAAGGNDDESDAQPVNLPEFENGVNTGADLSGIDLLSGVNLNVRIELGRTKMLVEDVLRLNEGSVVELDKLAGDPVDVYVNDRLVATGEVLVLNDSFSVRINEIVGQEMIGAPDASTE